MTHTSSIYDHFIIWPSSVTLTFNLCKQMFWTALLLLEDNNYAKLFWNPCINVPVMAQTSSIYDHFDLYFTPVTLTFKLREKMFLMALLLFKDNNCAKLFLKSMHKCTSYSPDKLYIWPFWPLFDPCDLDLPEKNVSNGTSPPRRQQLCKIILKSMHKCTSYAPEKLNKYMSYLPSFRKVKEWDCAHALDFCI